MHFLKKYKKNYIIYYIYIVLNLKLDLEDQLAGIEAACIEARIAADVLSPQEKAAFPDYTVGQNKTKLLFIR